MLEKLKSVLQNLFGKKKKDNNIRMPANLTAAEQKEIKSIIENARKDRSVPHTAQDSIPFDRMFSDGICRVGDNYYTETIQFQDINDFVNNTVATNDGILTSIKADEERLQEIAVLKKHILNYSKAKDTFAAYKASGYSKRFYEEHRDVLTLRKAAKQAFDEYREKHGEDVPIPRVKDLNAEYAEILARKKKNYTEYRREKSQMQEYLMAQKIVETMLHDDRNRQADQQREEQEKSKKQR